MLLNEVGDTKRGDLMLPQCGKNGKNLLLDFTITHPACSTYASHTVRNQNYAIQRARESKNRKYGEVAEANDIEFMPMVFECYGALSSQVIGILHTLCEKRSKMTNSNKSILLQYWYKRISCTLQKGNSRQIQNRILDITQSTANINDECFDRLIDQEAENIDTIVITH